MIKKSTWELATLFETRIKTKRTHRRITRIQSVTMDKKPFVEFNSKKRIEVEKYGDKEGNWNFDKALIVCQILLSIYILMFYYKQIFDLTVKDFS